MERKTPGRKPTGNQVREAEVYFNVTREDANLLHTLARQLGFDSRGQMLTAIIERLCIAKFAPIAFLKVGWQLASRAQQTGSSKGAGHWNPFREAIPPLEPAGPPRPPSSLPDQELAPGETKQLLAEVKKQLHTV